MRPRANADQLWHYQAFVQAASSVTKSSMAQSGPGTLRLAHPLIKHMVNAANSHYVKCTVDQT